MVRHSLNYVSWKQRKEEADDLKTIYQTTTVELIERSLKAFATKWDAAIRLYQNHGGITGKGSFRYLLTPQMSAKQSTLPTPSNL
jgi:hypothetical protein